MRLFGKELIGIGKNKRLLIPILAVLLVPVLYTGMFLWAFWDPYEQLDNLPVAVVNLDEGAEFSGEKLQIGDELVDKLKGNPEFEWDFVSAKKAEQGLADQSYYMVIEIPENFSSRAATVMDESPEKMEIRYLPNESYNFLSAQIGETAISRIKEEVSNELTSAYSEKMFDTIDKISGGLEKAGDGAGELADGAERARTGSNELKDKLSAFARGTVDFREGVSSAKTGSAALNDGMNRVSTATERLVEGIEGKQPQINELADGAGQLSSGLKGLENGLGQMKTSQEKLLEGADQARIGIGALEEGLNQSAEGIKMMKAKVDQSAGSMPDEKDMAGLTSTLEDAAKAGEAVNVLSGRSADLAEGMESLSEQMEPVIASMPEGPEKEQLQLTLQQLTGGSQSLAAGLGELKKSTDGLDQVELDSVQDLASLPANMKELSGGLGQLLEGQEQLETGAGQLAAGFDGTNNQPGLTDGLRLFGEKITEAQNGAKKLYSGSKQVSAGTEQTAAGWETLAANVGELASAEKKLVKGSGQLDSGLSELVSASGRLSDGAGKLTDGAAGLSGGIAELAGGSAELAGELSDAAEETGEVNGNDRIYEMFASPVTLSTEKLNHVPNYGTGFTPYFLSLGLYVGALILTIVFPLRDPAGIPASSISWFMSKFGVLVIIGLLQTLLADGLLLGVLGLEVQSVPLFILFTFFTSLAFMTLIQFLVTVFGDPGRFAAIIILILQLTTSAGTFPLELIPDFLQHFNGLLPMTYTVAGFKAVISSGDYAAMWKNASVISIFTGTMMAGTFAYFAYFFNRKFGIFAERKKRTA